jgi:hypothetical protein
MIVSQGVSPTKAAATLGLNHAIPTVANLPHPWGLDLRSARRVKENRFNRGDWADR